MVPHEPDDSSSTLNEKLELIANTPSIAMARWNISGILSIIAQAILTLGKKDSGL